MVKFNLFVLSAFLLLTCAVADEVDEVIRQRQNNVVLSTGGTISGGTTSPSTASTPSTSANTPTSTPTPSQSTTSRSTSSSTSTSIISTTSTVSSSSTSSRTTTTSQSSTTSTSLARPTTRTTEPEASTRVIEVTTTPLVATSVRPVITDFVTVIGGQTSTHRVTSQEVFRTTTGIATATAESIDNGGGSSSSGLSDSSKKIIGGVVGGVGGAVLLGAIGVVLFRLRKKRHAEDSDYDDCITEDKRQSSNTIFASHMDRYHSPANGPVNPSSNF